MYIHYKYTNNMISPWASYALSLQKNPQPNHLETAWPWEATPTRRWDRPERPRCPQEERENPHD